MRTRREGAATRRELDADSTRTSSKLDVEHSLPRTRRELEVTRRELSADSVRTQRELNAAQRDKDIRWTRSCGLAQVKVTWLQNRCSDMAQV